MTRAYYSQHEKEFSRYIDGHVATNYKGEEPKMKKQVKINKNILLSKMNANMLIQCEEAIVAGQVEELQKYKDDANRFDSSKGTYAKLVAVNFADYDMEPPADEEQLPEIKFTNAEQIMLNQIEDIND